MAIQDGKDAKFIFIKKLSACDFIRYSWTDIDGVCHGKTIPVRHVKDFFDKGMSIFNIVNEYGPRHEMWFTRELFEEGTFPNAMAKPDLTTLHLVPWAGDGKHRIAQVLCEVEWPEGPIMGCDPRAMARHQISELNKMNLMLKSGFDFEFTILKKEEGSLEPISGGGIRNTHVLQNVETFFADLDSNLQKMGVDMVSFHSKLGPGQFEVVLEPQEGIKGADNAFIFKHVIQELAEKQGWQVNFMAKMDQELASNGAHYNTALEGRRSGRNVFFDNSDIDKLSNLARYWIGGILRHARALCALNNPTANCYHHLLQPWAPRNVDWKVDGRLSLLRIKSQNKIDPFVENRLPSSACNPYLVMACTLAAGIDGIKNKVEPPKPGKESGMVVPQAIEDALEALEKNPVVSTALGAEFVEWFVGHKRGGHLPHIHKNEKNNKES